MSAYTPAGLGAPLAVGRAVCSSDAWTAHDAHGKAVRVLHTVHDTLWELGRGGDEPAARPWPVEASGGEETHDASQQEDEVAELVGGVDDVKLEQPENALGADVSDEEEPSAPVLSPEGPLSHTRSCLQIDILCRSLKYTAHIPSAGTSNNARRITARHIPYAREHAMGCTRPPRATRWCVCVPFTLLTHISQPHVQTRAWLI